jgi:hypothetical protein
MATTRRSHARRRSGASGRRISLVALVLVLALTGAGLAVVLAPGGPDFATLAGPLRSAADLLDPPTPSAPPPTSAGPSAPATTASASPSVRRRTSSAPPRDVTVVDPGRPNCAPKPSACGLPDATNTGVPKGTALTIVNGNITVTKSGTVIDRKDIRGCVRVQAPDVTIRRSKITCGDFYAVASFDGEYSGKGLLVEDSEITCGGPGTGLGDTNFTARRLNIHNCENGFDINGSVTVRDSYIHDLHQGGGAHTDGIQLAGGSDITIEHNTIFDNNGTSAIISHPTDNSDVLVASNLLAGGAYTLYCPRERSRNFRVVANRIATLFYPKGGAYGPWIDCADEAEVRDNVWDDTLKPL